MCCYFLLGFRIVDNMPIAWCYETQTNDQFCSPGFPFGCYVDANGEQQGACVIDVSLHNFDGSEFLLTV